MNTRVVRTRSGIVEGFCHGQSWRFLGIPYARAPFGADRFDLPRQHPTWEGVRSATVPGATSQRLALSQTTTIPEPSIPGDEVLQVSVFTPYPSREARLPVLVWFHGGGFVAGSPASPWYDGGTFNRDGVVTVNVGYRIGFEGFGWIRDAPNNRGVADWIAALEWVRDNIADFGGDPDAVTIAGQSAGGGAVLTLLASHGDRGLFHGAVAMSPAIADFTVTEALEFTGAVAQRLGVAPVRESLASIADTRIHAALGFDFEPDQNDDARQIVAGLVTMNGRLPMGPVLAAPLHPASVIDGLQRAESGSIPLLMGSTREEFSGFLAPARASLCGVDPKVALGWLGVPGELRAPYLAALGGEVDSRRAIGRALADQTFRSWLLRFAHARGSGPTWIYDFGWRSAISNAAEHCIELPFVFDNLRAEGVERVLGPKPPEELAREIHGDIADFVRSGRAPWQRVDPELKQVRVYGGRSGDDGYASARLLASASRR